MGKVQFTYLHARILLFRALIADIIVERVGELGGGGGSRGSDLGGVDDGDGVGDVVVGVSDGVGEDDGGGRGCSEQEVGELRGVSYKPYM